MTYGPIHTYGETQSYSVLMTDTDLVKYIVVEFASADVGGRKLVRLLCEPGAGRSRSDLVSGSGLRPFFYMYSVMSLASSGIVIGALCSSRCNFASSATPRRVPAPTGVWMSYGAVPGSNYCKWS